MWDGRQCKKVEARLRWYGHVIRRNEGGMIRDIME
jgi:hypothetical protein